MCSITCILEKYTRNQIASIKGGGPAEQKNLVMAQGNDYNKSRGAEVKEKKTARWEQSGGDDNETSQKRTHSSEFHGGGNKDHPPYSTGMIVHCSCCFMRRHGFLSLRL